MSDYVTYYTFSNVFCLIFFGVLLAHDVFNINRQEKQLKYDRALVAFMCYFLNDIFLAMVIDGFIPRNEPTVVIFSFTNYVCMAAITFTWLEYAMAAEQTPKRNDSMFRFGIFTPFIVSTVALVATYVSAHSLLIDENLVIKPVFYVFLIAVPTINIVAILFYALRKAVREKNPIERKQHIFIGILPVLIVICGVVEVVFFPKIPIFCSSCAVLMLIFHIKSMQTEISIDSLTGLNNRGELVRFISQRGELNQNEGHLFVVMIDVNGFKSINDTFGHAEGDRALTIIADSLKAASKDREQVLFLGRYGGDEFIMIVKADSGAFLDSIIKDLRAKIVSECESADTPYILSIGAGYDEFAGDSHTFRGCIQRADEKMYEDKGKIKASGKSTVIRGKGTKTA